MTQNLESRNHMVWINIVHVITQSKESRNHLVWNGTVDSERLIYPHLDLQGVLIASHHCGPCSQVAGPKKRALP